MNQTRSTKLRRGLKLGIVAAICAPLLATAVAWSLAQVGYTLTANLTPSIPTGLYLANANNRAAVRDALVAFEPHNSAARYAYTQGWMKPGSKYVKRVAAIAGDTVCAGAELTIRTASAGSPARFIRVGKIARVDRRGAPLPHLLRGCVRVPEGYFLPVGDGLPNSYDGRYYGLVPVPSIDANLRPLWTFNDTKE